MRESYSEPVSVQSVESMESGETRIEQMPPREQVELPPLPPEKSADQIQEEEAAKLTRIDELKSSIRESITSGEMEASREGWMQTIYDILGSKSLKAFGVACLSWLVMEQNGVPAENMKVEKEAKEGRPVAEFNIGDTKQVKIELYTSGDFDPKAGEGEQRRIIANDTGVGKYLKGTEETDAMRKTVSDEKILGDFMERQMKDLELLKRANVDLSNGISPKEAATLAREIVMKLPLDTELGKLSKKLSEMPEGEERNKLAREIASQGVDTQAPEKILAENEKIVCRQAAELFKIIMLWFKSNPQYGKNLKNTYVRSLSGGFLGEPVRHAWDEVMQFESSNTNNEVDKIESGYFEVTPRDRSKADADKGMITDVEPLEIANTATQLRERNMVDKGEYKKIYETVRDKYKQDFLPVSRHKLAMEFANGDKSGSEDPYFFNEDRTLAREVLNSGDISDEKDLEKIVHDWIAREIVKAEALAGSNDESVKKKNSIEAVMRVVSEFEKIAENSKRSKLQKLFSEFINIMKKITQHPGELIIEE
jgi:hypothetical protein